MSNPHPRRSDGATGFDFPCRFPIKVMGTDQVGFPERVAEQVRRHLPPDEPLEMRKQLSRKGTYVSVTITITARDRTQLEAIYHDLSASDEVLMTL